MIIACKQNAARSRVEQATDLTKVFKVMNTARFDFSDTKFVLQIMKYACYFFENLPYYHQNQSAVIISNKLLTSQESLFCQVICGFNGTLLNGFGTVQKLNH